MTPRGKTAVLALIFLFAVLQIYAVSTRSEIYPFSWFGMYSGYAAAQNAQTIRFMLVKEDGGEAEYFKYVQVEGGSDYLRESHRLLERNATADERTVFFTRISKDLKESYRRALQKNVDLPPFRKLRVYLLQWDLFSGPRFLTPDRTSLLHEEDLDV